MLMSHYPYMTCLPAQYACEPIHSLILLSAPEEVQWYLPHWNLGTEDTMDNTVFLLLVASPKYHASFLECILQGLNGDAARTLVRKGNKEGLTALHFAVLRSCPDTVKLLLKYGADPNAGAVQIRRRSFGLTPLHLSLMTQSSDAARACFRLLMEHNADVGVEMLTTSRGRYAVTPTGCFSFECDCGGCWSRDVVGFNAVPPLYVIGTTWTASKGAALNIATNLGSDYYAKDILRQRQPDMELTDEWGWTPLAFAVCHLNVDLTNLLVQRGADVNRSGASFYNYEQMAPLHILLRCYAFNYTCVYECSWCANRYTETVSEDDVNQVALSLFQSPRLDVNQVDYQGWSPLSLAIRFKRMNIVRLIFQTGIASRYYSYTWVDLQYVLGFNSIYLNLDCKLIECMYRIGAVSRDNLREMKKCVDDTLLSSDIWTTEDAISKARRFSDTLGNLRTTLPTLQDLCVHRISDRMGIDSPMNRKRRFNDSELHLPASCLKFAGCFLFD